MRHLAPKPEQIPGDAEDAQAVDCPECGETGYIHQNDENSPPPACIDCVREGLKDRLKGAGGKDRARLFRRVKQHGLLPIKDPNDDDSIGLVVAVRTKQNPGFPGSYVCMMEKIVGDKPDCPACGYDRARSKYQNHYHEHQHTVRCNVCEAVIRADATF